MEEHIYKQTPQGYLSMFVHLPQGWKPTDKRPAIVFFFGGGFKTGKITEFLRQAEYFSKRGMVSVRVDYRVEEHHGTMPDKCVEDGKSAIRWLRENAGRFGVDPERIAASGHSAGATVAACAYTAVGLEAEGENLAISSKPNLLALFNAPLDVSQYYLLYLGSEDIADSLSPNDNLTEGFLHSAASGEKTGVSEALITHVADLNAKDKDGYTPLYSAIWKEREEVVRLLVD